MKSGFLLQRTGTSLKSCSERTMSYHSKPIANWS